MARRQKKESCPVAAAARVISRKWVLLILRDLSTGTQRFGTLQRSIGASPRVLSARLDELEREGIVARHYYPEVPPRVEYTLTEKGRTLIPLIEDLRRVGKRLL